MFDSFHETFFLSFIYFPIPCVNHTKMITQGNYRHSLPKISIMTDYQYEKLETLNS